MFSSTHLGDVMETSCNQCKSRFRLTDKQLQQAYGQVRCSECGAVFNALLALKNYDGELPPGYLEQQYEELLAQGSDDLSPDARLGSENEAENARNLSLHEAMYGSERRSFFSAGPLTWFIGILLLVAVGIAQTIYYKRYQLIENPRYQQQVINLCQMLPCVTGSFVNQAPFAQKMPELLISLFDVQGKLIANRLFRAPEYLPEDRNRGVLAPQMPIQFRLEIVDPGTDALTYEFEFF